MELIIAPFDMSSAGDMRSVGVALAKLPLAKVRQLAVVAKIEGTATLNDVSRELASAGFREQIIGRGGVLLWRRTTMVLSVGCEGLITPGGWLIAALAGRGGKETGLVMGHARSPAVPANKRATPTHIHAAAAAVRAAMRKAVLKPGETELVLIKSPVLLSGKDLTPGQRRHMRSTGASRGAAALGAALALGEVQSRDITQAVLCADDRLYSVKTMAFSGTETDCCEAVVLGNRVGGDPRMRVERRLLSDILDCAPLLELIDERPPLATFFKAGIGRDGVVRGCRTTVLTSELPPDKQLRAAASGIVGGTLKTTRAFISGGAEHQAPPGHCIAAVIRRSE